MKDQIHLQIVTTDGTVYDGNVSYAEIPLENGSIGILRDHAPMIGAVVDGVVKARHENGEDIIAVGIGVANVVHNELTLLVRTAERAEDIDPERAAASEQRARGRLADKICGWDMTRAEVSLRRALARQKAVQMLKK